MKSIATAILLLFASVSSAEKQIDRDTYNLVSDTYPPYEYIEDGRIIGMDVEILEVMAKNAAITISVKFVPWKRAMAMAKNGIADGIFSMAHSKKREEIVYFPPVPLSFGKQRIFANNNFKGDIVKIDDLENRKVGAVNGNRYGNEFDDYTGHILEYSHGPEMLFRKLAANRHLFSIENEFVAAHTIKKLKLKGIRPLSYISDEPAYYIGVSKSARRAQHFLEIVNKTLFDMKHSGELDEIRRKYHKLFHL